MLEKSPAASSVVKNIPLFEPYVLASEKSGLLHREMSALLTRQMKLKILPSAKHGEIDNKFLEFLGDELKINVEMFQSFSCNETALYDFFFKLADKEK